MPLDLSMLSRLRDRDLRQEGRFITEGRLVTERALASAWPIDLVACVPAWREHFAALAAGRCELAVLEEKALAQVAGFPFHRGVLGVGRRTALPSPAKVAVGARLLVALPEVNTVENLGAVFRSASALGAGGVLLGPQAGDPLCRRAIKASAGSVFTIPFAEVEALPETLLGLRAQGWQTVGSVAAPGAPTVGQFRPQERVVLLFGNEAAGLGPEHLALCDERVTVPMVGPMDSLNLAVAAGVVLYAVAQAMGLLPCGRGGGQTL